MARTLGLLGLLTALAVGRAAQAQVELTDQNQLLSIVGRVSADQKAASQAGYSGISIGFTGASPDKLVWVGVVKAESWNDDVFAGREMLAMVQGFTPTMLASGRPALLTKIQQAPVGSRIAVEGIFDQGARTYLVGMVEVTAPGSR
jgi:hypothetical protein